jgi:hypothetical protein
VKKKAVLDKEQLFLNASLELQSQFLVKTDTETDTFIIKNDVS